METCYTYSYTETESILHRTNKKLLYTNYIVPQLRIRITIEIAQDRQGPPTATIWVETDYDAPPWFNREKMEVTMMDRIIPAHEIQIDKVWIEECMQARKGRDVLQRRYNSIAARKPVPET